MSNNEGDSAHIYCERTLVVHPGGGGVALGVPTSSFELEANNGRESHTFENVTLDIQDGQLKFTIHPSGFKSVLFVFCVLWNMLMFGGVIYILVTDVIIPEQWGNFFAPLPFVVAGVVVVVLTLRTQWRRVEIRLDSNTLLLTVRAPLSGKYVTAWSRADVEGVRTQNSLFTDKLDLVIISNGVITAVPGASSSTSKRWVADVLVRRLTAPQNNRTVP